MPVKFILGRSGSGKSRYCLDAMRNRLKTEAEGPPLILLVPEQATFQAEYDLVTTPGIGGIIRAQALSFKRLAWRVMQETGGTARIHIDDSGKQMLLRRILHEQKEQLQSFQRSAEQSGFIERLNELFNEFRRYCVTPQEFMKSWMSGTKNSGLSKENEIRFQKKMQDLAILYSKYDELLSLHYLDSEHLLTTLSEQLDHSEVLREAEIWIDGFHGFTPQEFQVIRQLITNCRQVQITVCVNRDIMPGDAISELDLFYPTASTLRKLREITAELQAEEEETVFLQDTPRFAVEELAHLERHFETRKPFGVRSKEDRAGAQDTGIYVQSAATLRAETEAAARNIAELVRDYGYRYRDIGVMLRNIELYGDLIENIFHEYEIPIFMDHKRTVHHHPAVELIRAAFEIVQGNWRYEAVFRAVKTDFFLPIPTAMNSREIARLRGAMDQLENVVLAAGIQGSRWQNEEVWRAATRRTYDLENEEKAADASNTWQYELISGCRRLVTEPLLDFERKLKNAECVREQIASLYDLLTALQVPQRLEAWSAAALEDGRPERAREHTQVWDKLIDLMDQVNELMGSEELSGELFAEVMQSGLDSIRLGLVPPSLDQVLIGTMERSRPGEMKHIFILGAGDGVLPSKMDEDGVLTESERLFMNELGLELAPDSRRKLMDEQFFIYRMLSLPSHSLRLSYPIADDEGRTLLPSEIVMRIRRMYSLDRIPLWQNDPGTAASGNEAERYLQHSNRSMTFLAVQLREWLRGQMPLEAPWRSVYNWYQQRPEWKQRLDAVLRSLFFQNEEAQLSRETVSALYGDPIRTSVSRMEMYAACAFSHFAAYGLRLKERRVFRLDAPDIGQLFHAALKRIALDFHGDRWAQMTSEECRRAASDAVDTLAPRLQSQILLSSNRYTYISHKLKQIVERAAAVLSEHARRGEFVPAGLELGFGPGESLPPLNVSLTNGFSMEIVGRIDRVDRAQLEGQTLLRIIDYKSGNTSLKLPEVYFGLSLQMLTYLDAAVSHAEDWLGAAAEPAGVLYFHVHNPIMAKARRVNQEQAERDLLKQFKMKGLVLGDAKAAALMDSKLEDGGGHSELIPVALKKDGQFYKSSHVATSEEWKRLIQHTRTLIHRIGRDMTDGIVDISPYQLGQQVPCTFCSYRSVCQFDPQMESSGYRKLPVFGSQEAMQYIMHSEGGED